jgi:hypothetical protein
MKTIINKILRDHGVLDNGASEKVAYYCEQALYEQLRMEISFSAIAIEAMSGLLSNHLNNETPKKQIIDDAYELATILHERLYGRLDLLQQASDARSH